MSLIIKCNNCEEESAWTHRLADKSFGDRSKHLCVVCWDKYQKAYCELENKLAGDVIALKKEWKVE